MKYNLKSIACVVVMFGFFLVVPSQDAFAVNGNLDYNTFMYKSYASSSGLETFTQQWKNYDQWVDEMDDIADQYISRKGTTILDHYLEAGNCTGSHFVKGHDADLVLVQTHARHTGSHGSSNYTGWLNNSSGSDDLSSRNTYPSSSEAEIYILWGCDYMSKNNYSQWYGFRNLHWKGARVAAGCWGTCWISTWGANSTFNELGDAIADDEQTIKSAWWEALGVGSKDSGNVIFGLGKKTADNCDNRARNVSFQNRLNYTTYSYPKNQSAGSSAYELCGYYVSSYDCGSTCQKKS